MEVPVGCGDKMKVWCKISPSWAICLLGNHSALHCVLTASRRSA